MEQGVVWGFGAAVAAKPTYSSWWRRAGAYGVDLAIALVLAFVVLFSLGALDPAIGLACFLATLPAYFTIGHGGASGQTFGKRALGIAVVRKDGGRLGHVGALGRFLVGLLIGWIPLVGILDLLAPLWDGQNRAWHDRIAGSVVVRR